MEDKNRASLLPQSLQPVLPLIGERLSHSRSSLASSSAAYRSVSPLRSRLRAKAYELKINRLVISKKGLADEEGEKWGETIRLIVNLRGGAKERGALC